jgi:sensor histidine kinase YesM
MNIFYKEFPKALKLTVIIFLVLQLLDLMWGKKFTFGFDLVINFAFTALYTLSLYFVNTVVIVYLDLICVDKFSKKRLISGFLCSFLASLIVIFLIHVFESVVFEGKSFELFLANEKPRYYIIPIVITFFVTLSIYTISFYKAYNEHKFKEQKIIAGTASAKFESLKNQIDPHFLFNSLNVLSALIEENPDSAQRFTTSLSKVYRYVLEQKDKELVTVEEELSFAKTYMNLLKMRFENSLTYELPTESINPEAKVVPLSLQLLLENTVKHNIVSEQKPLHIKIYLSQDFLCIENNLQKKEVLQDRRGVGLQNIISRYKLFSNRTVLINQTEKTFTVKIPILIKDIIIMKNQNIYTEENAYFEAKNHVDELKAFYGSLIAYCVVIPICIFTNLMYSSNYQWFWFPMFGWGFGLVMKTLRVYGFFDKWEERKIQEILNKENK